jgi:hypothetical protein
MPTLSEFPYFPIEFTKDGAVHQRAEVDALLAFLQKDATTDLLVLSHGWNNDMAEAKTLYECLLKRLRSFAPKNRKFAVLGVLWPSKKFADQAQIPSGAASKNSRTTDAALLTELKRLRGVFDTPEADKLLKEAEAQVPFLEDKQTARTKFAELVCGVLASVAPSDTAGAGAEVTKPTPSADLLKKFGEPLLVKSPPAKPGAATSGQVMTIGEGVAGGHAATGQVAGLGDFFGGIKDGAMNLLNYTTYYQMKERAGTVGNKGLRPVLAEIKKALPGLKLHLAGHSFGGRLVTATVSSQADFQVETLTLRQKGQRRVLSLARGYPPRKRPYPHHAQRTRFCRGQNVSAGLAPSGSGGGGYRRCQRQIWRHWPQRCPGHSRSHGRPVAVCAGCLYLPA